MDILKTTLLHAASDGDKKKIKRSLHQGVPVDSCNEGGQTALQLACLEGHISTVELLLQNGADPNRRDYKGGTAVHAAAIGGHTKILERVVASGGDLRLHDNKGRDVRHWISRLTDVKKQNKMLELFGRKKWLAQQLEVEETTPQKFVRLKDELSMNSTFMKIHTQKTSNSASCIYNVGFGKIYLEGSFVGALSSVTLVPETSLKHDEYGFTFNDGPFMVMESMYWLNTQVTVKRLHKSPPSGGQVDLLIEECKQISRLRHPNILLLMGQCHTKHCDNLVLVFERVHLGSLFSYLYQKVESVSCYLMCEIMRQICDAVMFLHQMGFVHCAITSHAIHLVSHGIAKLGNFEYMIQKSKDLTRPPPALLENRYPNALYNWLAPEVMAGYAPSERSDLYSLVAVIWEVLNGMPPWSGMNAVDIQLEMVSNHSTVQINSEVGHPFSLIMEYGLCSDPQARQMTVMQVRSMLHSYLLDEENAMIKKKHLTPLWEQTQSPQVQTVTVESAVLEEETPTPVAAKMVEVVATTTDSSQITEEDDTPCSFIEKPESTPLHRNETSTPLPSTLKAKNSSIKKHPMSEPALNESYVSSRPDPLTDQDGRTTCQMGDLSEISANDSIQKVKKSTRRKSSTTKSDVNRGSSFLRNTARKMFRRSSKSETEESACEQDRTTKRSKSEPKQSSRKKKKRKSSKLFPFDLSGVSKLHSDSTQPSDINQAPDNSKTAESDASQSSQNSTNPFKKFTNATYEDIISDEIKAILAKPINMPKLPSQIRRESLSAQRQSIDQPGSVYGTLVRKASQTSTSRRILSPLEVSSLSNSHNRSVISPLKASGSSHSLNSSTVKPASHHTPDKNEINSKFLPHFAFPKVQRATTLPGNVTYHTRHWDVDLGSTINRSSAKQENQSKPTKVQTGTQTTENLEVTSGSKSGMDHTKINESAADRSIASQRDIFFGVQSPSVPQFRSDSALGHNSQRSYKASPRNVDKVKKSDKPTTQSAVLTPRTRAEHKSIHDKIASFQGQIEEHYRKQALFLKNKPGILGDTFQTPKHLKKEVVPRRMENLDCYRVGRAINPVPMKTSVASIYVEKPRVLECPRKSPNVDAHGTYNEQPQSKDFAKQAISKMLEERQKRMLSDGCNTGSETEEEVNRFVDKVIRDAHGDVRKKYSPKPSKSDVDVDYFVQRVIENVHTDVTKTVITQGAMKTSNQNNNNVSLSTGGGSARSSDEFSKKSDGDIEEIYFDDVLDSSLCQDRNMRLQSTMALDTPDYITSALQHKKLYASGKPTGSPKQHPAKGTPSTANVATYDDSTPRYPGSALSGRRFRFSRTVTRVTEDEAEDTEQDSRDHDSSGTIDV